MLNKQPLPFLTASAFADRFEVTCGQVAKELQAYACGEGVVHFFNFRTPKVNIILDFVPLQRKSGLKLAEKLSL
jgi:hypothetical protein